MKFLFYASLFSGLFAGVQAAGRPNVLLIMADDHDPEENHNVAKANPSIVADLDARLNKLPPYKGE